jgi:protein Tex
MQSIQFIQTELQLGEKQIRSVVQLLDEGATIPFISRYRKERTGGLDEVQVAAIRDLHKKWNDLEERKAAILASIREQGLLTDVLQERIENVAVLSDLEDIYLPFKPKRRTKAQVARELGLEPLAKQIMAQRGIDPEQIVGRYLNQALTEPEDALQGAVDIMAEWINENTAVRSRLRGLFERKATIQAEVAKGKEEAGQLYRDYFNHNERLSRCPSHRFLAIIRASKEGILKIKALPEREEALEQIERIAVRGNGTDSVLVRKACKESYARLLSPSLETEALGEAKTKADGEAIAVFSKNLKQLLMSPPLGAVRVLALDPGFRTGCKLVCLNEQGELIHNETIFPHPPQKEIAKASSKIAQLVETYKIDAIAIGDGTAGRETESFIKNIRFRNEVQVFVVREDGASIYSASPIARKEFPDYDVTVRGAVSIGRRLMDPLAELVKIDPKSLGVGQYQHDVDQKKLKEALDDVVISAVNAVGVDLNTASPYLLSYVSGLSSSLAENIVAYRTEHGAFQDRLHLKHVPRLGDKAFEQCAGFLRIRNGKNTLDSTAVHPESYGIVRQFAKNTGLSIEELIGNESVLTKLIDSEDLSFTEVDILNELRKPGRDPRSKAKILEFSKSIRTIDDLIVGQRLPGIVTNVTNFGAFVNIGIKENGLIHKSQLADVYVENPSDFIALHDHVEVLVVEIDKDRKRIGLKRIHQ